MGGPAADLYRFTVDDFERMATAGVLPERGLELVDGLVVEMSPKGDRHAYAVMVLTHAFVAQSRGRYHVNAENLTVKLGPREARDPDLALARAGRSYARARPRPDELALVVEVADASLHHDLDEKKAAYARVGIPEYWVVDLPHGAFIVHRSPNRFDASYLVEERHLPDATVSPAEFNDVSIVVSSVLGLDDVTRRR
jgi:Uma2 family endonuclease